MLLETFGFGRAHGRRCSWPFAYERGGAHAGAATAVGFLLPVLLS
jgi:hypothetical protein